jgi:hypothetical protein
MVLAQEQTAKPMDKNRRSRYKPMQHSQLIFNKGAKTHDGEKTASSTNVAGKNWISTCRKLKIYPCLSPCTKINTKTLIEGLKL